MSKRVLITGATGMTGGIALRRCLESSEVSAVTTLGRRATGQEHAKLEELVHGDFEDLSPLAGRLGGYEVALYCLGVYTGSVPDDQFAKITRDYTIGFAKALHAESPGAAVCFLSGMGADPTERSRVAFARYKGAAEKALLAQGFGRVHIFRPGYIYPVEPREEPNWTYRLSRRLYPLVRALGPKQSVTSEELAQGMVEAGLHGTGAHTQPVLENIDIRRLVGSA